MCYYYYYHHHHHHHHRHYWANIVTDLVTLNTRRSLAQRKTLTPSGSITSVWVRIISTMLKTTTNESNRLNMESKYFCTPSAYIFTSISIVNRETKKMLTTSETAETKLYFSNVTRLTQTQKVSNSTSSLLQLK